MARSLRSTRILVVLTGVALSLAFVLGMTLMPQAEAAQTPNVERKTSQSGPALNNEIAGEWRVEWVGSSSSEFIGAMTLTEEGDGTVSGQITWRLTKTPREDMVGRIDSTGVEYIRGTFSGSNGLLIMKGYRKDDPDGILALDQYRLLLSPNGKFIAGMTANNGTWMGRFWAFR